MEQTLQLIAKKFHKVRMIGQVMECGKVFLKQTLQPIAKKVLCYQAQDII
jgi:hypothetical protein